MSYRLTAEEIKTLAAHDRMAGRWDSFTPRRVKDPMFGEFFWRTRRGGALLDSGCATGTRDLGMVRAEGLRYIGIDLSPRMLAFARSNHGEQGLFVQMDVRNLAFADNSLNAFLLMGVLQNIPHRDARSVLEEHRRVLGPDGVGLVSVVTLGGKSSIMHFSPRTDESTLVVSWRPRDIVSVFTGARLQVIRQWQIRPGEIYLVGKSP